MNANLWQMAANIAAGQNPTPKPARDRKRISSQCMEIATFTHDDCLGFDAVQCGCLCHEPEETTP